jgi:WD40 repeat protein
MLAYNFANDRFAFAMPGKIAISSNKTLPSTVVTLDAIKPKAICSHLAFSDDNTKLTCVADGKIYIIDINSKVIAPIDVSAPIFSGILISHLLYFITINGNTYLYNLRKRKLMHLDKMIDLDYFTTGTMLDNEHILFYGLSQGVNADNLPEIKPVSGTVKI